MSEAMHPAAPHHFPFFITAPGETDVLFTGSVIFLVLAIMGIGSLYFWLHALPERLSHGAGQFQFQFVAVLSLLALFTHNAAFWVAALLLALIPVPDFWTPLASMADSLARMATRWAGASTAKAPSEPPEVVANYPPQAEAQAAPVPNEIAANGPPDDDALPPAPASSDHERKVLSVGGHER